MKTKTREEVHAETRAKKEAAREPLTDKNAVTYEMRVGRSGELRQFKNTPGHVHTALRNHVELRITKGVGVYKKWCKKNKVDAYEERMGWE